MHTFLLSLPDSRYRRLSALRQIQGSGLSLELVDGVEAGKMRGESLPIDHLYAQLSRRGLFYQSIKPLIGIQGGLPSDIQ